MEMRLITVSQPGKMAAGGHAAERRYRANLDLDRRGQPAAVAGGRNNGFLGFSGLVLRNVGQEDWGDGGPKIGGTGIETDLKRFRRRFGCDSLYFPDSGSPHHQGF